MLNFFDFDLFFQSSIDFNQKSLMTKNEIGIMKIKHEETQESVKTRMIQV